MGIPLIQELLQAGRDSLQQACKTFANQISNIRYGPISGDKGTILFDFLGTTREIPEPPDVLLVDYDGAARWIACEHLIMLAEITKEGT